jgi:uncharacterized protein (DUF3820 family)
MTPIILTLSSRIPFGQYKGRLVSDILKLDPKYLKWLWIEKKAITPDNILKQKLKENMKVTQLRESIRQIIRKELKEGGLLASPIDLAYQQGYTDAKEGKPMDWSYVVDLKTAYNVTENQPAKSPTPSRQEPATLPKPKIDKPDEKRRKIGNPSVKPAPKNLKEEEMIDKITARFTKAKKIK